MNASGMIITDALDDCLELLAQGDTVEQCLERHPDISDELAPLLRLAMRTQDAAEAVMPSPEAQRAGLGRITDAWTAMRARRGRRVGPLRVLSRSWAVAALAALVLVFGGWTAAAAAAGSVPGEALYPVKAVQERVLLLVVFTDSGRADLHARLAQTRTMEATKLASRGSDAAAVDETTERMEAHAREAVALMGGHLSAQGAVTEGVLRIKGPGNRAYGLSRYTSVSGELSITGTPFWTDPATGFVRPWRGHGSQRRFAMQERFYQQFLHFQEMRGILPPELLPDHRAHVEAAFQRSEDLLLEAFLIMKALEDAQNPPE